MFEITLRGGAYERGLQQGKAYAKLLGEISEKSPAWLGGLSQARIADIRGHMLHALDRLNPGMLEELHGIADGSGLDFEQVCTVNFVSAIGALNGCTNLVTLNSPEAPALSKTSDIGDDFVYYSLQRVEPEKGWAYLAVSWAGCLWAELGMNAVGLAVGTSSAPTQPGQAGEGIPTQEYPRSILETCRDVAEAISYCKATPMAGKGLNIALLDAAGNAAVVEKSGTATAVRFPAGAAEGCAPGRAPGSVYCTNIYLEEAMQGFKPLSIPGLPLDLDENSRQRLGILADFLSRHPAPSRGDLENLLQSSLDSQGLCQETYGPALTHFAYILVPSLVPGQGRLTVYEGVVEKKVVQKDYRI